MEILTGTPAGEVDSNREYPEGTVNHLIAKRLGVLDDSVRGYFQGLFASGGNANPGKAKDSRTTKTPRSVSFLWATTSVLFWLVVFIAPNLAK